MIETIYNNVGFFGPYILTLFSIFYMFRTPNYNMWLFISFNLINVVLNFVLKNVIKEPRPDNEKEFMNIQRLNIDKYGMPSGHAQVAWYNVGILVLNSVPLSIKILSLSIACLTLYQRYIFNNHSVDQLIVGTVVGLLFAYISDYYIKYSDYR